MAVPAAMSAHDLDRVLNELSSLGIRHYEDFVVTESRRGCVDELPAWLVEVETGLRYQMRKHTA